MIAIPAGFSPQEYLAMEHEDTMRHEYWHGLVYAMAGGSDNHSRLRINLLTEINLHLRDRDCQFFAGDVKVNYADDFFYYPDAFVTGDPRDGQRPALEGHREDRYEMQVECRRRISSNPDQWETEIYGAGEQVLLKSIGLEVAIADLYRGVNSAP